jgi:hypothetical protein
VKSSDRPMPRRGRLISYSNVESEMVSKDRVGRTGAGVGA